MIMKAAAVIPNMIKPRQLWRGPMEAVCHQQPNP
jgi:hypothetical protein